MGGHLSLTRICVNLNRRFAGRSHLGPDEIAACLTELNVSPIPGIAYFPCVWTVYYSQLNSTWGKALSIHSLDFSACGKYKLGKYYSGQIKSYQKKVVSQKNGAFEFHHVLKYFELENDEASVNFEVFTFCMSVPLKTTYTVYVYG